MSTHRCQAAGKATKQTLTSSFEEKTNGVAGRRRDKHLQQPEFVNTAMKMAGQRTNNHSCPHRRSECGGYRDRPVTATMHYISAGVSREVLMPRSGSVVAVKR